MKSGPDIHSKVHRNKIGLLTSHPGIHSLWAFTSILLPQKNPPCLLRLCKHHSRIQHVIIVVIALFFTLIFRPFSQPCHPRTRSSLSLFPLLSLLSTLLSRYRLAIRLTTLTNSYDLMTIPFILFLFFIPTLSFDEMRT